MNSPNRRHRQGNGLLFLLFMFAIFFARRWDHSKPESPPASRVSTPVRNPIGEMLQPSATPYRDGIAAAILIDTSGSMGEKVRDTDGSLRPKIDIARRAAMGLVTQFDTYTREHSGKEILLGIYEFSNRDRNALCRPVVPLGMPDPNASRDAISRMRAEGGTPIGDAMIYAKRELDKGGLSKRHILVITDGENTTGYSPEDVTRFIANQSENDRASIYFVAFDVAAAKFNVVRDSGALVLAASNETELKGTLDYLLTGQIFAEQPQQQR